jgi:tRNA(Ile)-lysidine synthase TilS/MesJ
MGNIYPAVLNPPSANVVAHVSPARIVQRLVVAADKTCVEADAIDLNARWQVLGEFGCPAVMLGHHRGDVQENVVSNVMRGCGPLLLSGMTKQSTINKVMGSHHHDRGVLRPRSQIDLYQHQDVLGH